MTRRGPALIDLRPTVRDPELAGRFARTIELSRLMIVMKRQQVRREHPGWSADEIAKEVGRWRLKGGSPSDSPR